MGPANLKLALLCVLLLNTWGWSADSQDPAVAGSASPYIRMHARDGIAWQLWNQQTIERARKQNKPIFLAIGFFTCYWCQVMERDSFRDPDVVRALNESFVPVLVDREEQPDVDQYFSGVAEQRFGTSGWPLNLVLAPGLEPNWAETYLPSRPRDGLPGLAPVLRDIASHWQDSGTADLHSADVRNAVAALSNPVSYTLQQDIETALQRISGAYDERYGGFGGAPKFIRPTLIEFLLAYPKRTGDERALHMAQFTLEQIRRSPVHDQIGGGFFRVAMRPDWSHPHFEKTLSDQALAAQAYLDEYKLTGWQHTQEVVEATLALVLREARDKSGTFYSSIGSESDGGADEEGAYYRWARGEMERAAGSKIVSYRYGLDEAGVPFIARSVADTAKALHISTSDAEAELARADKKLLKARRKRVQPLIDRQVVTAWNGLLISTFARAGKEFANRRYERVAEKTADQFVSAFERHASLGRELVGGIYQQPAYLDDYAFLVQALLDLHDAGGQERYLDAAARLQRQQDTLFGNASRDYSFARGTNGLPVSPASVADEDEPSAAAVTVENLERAGIALHDEKFLKESHMLLQKLLMRIGRNPESAPSLLRIAAGRVQ